MSFLSTARLRDGAGNPIGRIEQEFAFFERVFTIYDAGGAPIARSPAS